ncbi:MULTISPECIES: SMI1/KNR4 family protein [Paenibacillus]|uniref:SMI1/KNR4 family protein n=1 Tax=Paenibacillus TaxID=44249 RepID=UPI00096BFB93|nr:SMI1/KNR4 family protein [Paenibacillus odorifer]OMC95645.1 spore coat protein [Paenibacillus odorifer]OMD00974.1 spore coat protein [Paenibacillus odorifer]OMD19160.1 spore coat protein [Paenibacillus odorifer]OMD25159.1 spore coat protein [Paenibacillus odorifer]OME58298.1 spore coat protein [Paenibacillus odorifer]
MNEKIIKMIEEYGEERDFFGGASEEDIRNAEEMLGLKFPQSYREFLKEYGSGGICGVEILGVQGNLGASVVKATERWRNIGLDIGLIVIEDSGEFVRCMYSADVNDNRVFSWIRGGGELSVRYDTFDDYTIDMFQEGIDNL